MSFSALAIEIRLQILSPLLVLPTPITFSADRGPLSPPLRRLGTDEEEDKLHPSILLVSKSWHHDGSLLLYYYNTFQFPEVCTSHGSFTPDSSHIAPFIHQIGTHARHIRHISISFPTLHIQIYERTPQARSLVHEVHVENLELLRENCESLRRLELLVPPEGNWALDCSPAAEETMDAFDVLLKSILPEREVIVNFQVYPDEKPEDSIMEKIRGFGWTVRFTRLPKRTCNSSRRFST
ncbi:uncharacterized protein RAG0_09954 [Rhynchosporium agropyri]|uniref:Uncharacterized protein n=1 Tax=Rhynchosporium agropyri TaxID=914238 RepID=A0A1E1KXV5_9HELO|nr:uncharacterized protein RAG0_09954 [Rhynchosporium agropyri]